MQNNDILQKARIRRSVLKRTRPRTDLPDVVLYVEWLAGQGKRKVLDAEGKEHLLDDTVVQSQYRLVSGAEAKTLLAKHWAKIAAEKPKS